jgi:hypothetical protein
LEPDGKLLVASDQKATDPAWRLFGFECNALGAIEQNGKHVACLDASERRADAVVNAAAERHVATRDAPPEIDLVGSFELVGVAIGGAPEQ